MPIVSSNFTSGWISRRLNNIKGSDVVGNGLLRADNVVVQVNGGVSKRPGLKFVSALASTRNKTFRRVFLWRRNETERLVLACATDGTIVILTDDGTEIPVENALNKGELRELRFYAYSTQGIFTDREPVRSILGIPQRLSAGAQFLLTSDAGGADINGDAAAELKDYGRDGDPAYTQEADQPIALRDYRQATKSAVLEVGELRSTFTPDAQGRASVFTNNPRTYKNASGGGNTTITISSVALEGGNRLRLVLSAFPAWLEKAVVRWGTAANPARYSREFTSANSQNAAALSQQMHFDIGGVNARISINQRNLSIVNNPFTAALIGAQINIRIVGAQIGNGDYTADISGVNGNVLTLANQSAGFPNDLNVGGGSISITLQELAQWNNARGAYSVELVRKTTDANNGLEANDRDFIAVAREITDTTTTPPTGRNVLIRGRDFYIVNAQRNLERLPLKNRRVTSLVVDGEFNRQPVSTLLLMDKRTIQGASAEQLKQRLSISRFIAFRQPFAPPPLRRHFSEQAYNAEIERLGNKRFGVNATGTENDIEWEANTPTNADGDELIPVKGVKGSQSNRGELRRVGVLPEFVDATGADQTTRQTVTGWKKAGGQVTDNTDTAQDPDPFKNALIAHWGVLKTSPIANNEPLIGKPQGRYTMIWNDVDDYPATAVRSQGRLCYAGTAGYPSTIWMSFINDPANFLEARPAAGDAKGKSVQADYAIDLELEGAAIEEMIQDAVLLILTQNEAHTARGQFNATNLSTSILKSFGHFGQENNISVAVIDEHIFIYSSGAAFGFWYAGDDIGYQPQNISARRNEDIFRDENGGMLNVVRIAAAQPRDLNGAFMVLFLMSDGSVRVWHTLHKQEFFAWSRWNFFAVSNRGVSPDDANFRKIIDIAAQGEKVVLLDNGGNLFELDGQQTWDDNLARAGNNESLKEDIEITLETPSFAEPQYDGDALLYPKQVKSAQFYFRHISGETYCSLGYEFPFDDGVDLGDTTKIPVPPNLSGSITRLPPENAVSEGRRYLSGGEMDGGLKIDQQDTEIEYTMKIQHRGVDKWELSRLDVDLDIGRTIQVVAEIRGEGAGRSAYRNPRIMGTP